MESQKVLFFNVYLEHRDGDSTGVVSSSESIQLAAQKFLAVKRLNDDVQTGQDGVSLSQEVAVGHEFGLGNASELAELLLVFGVGLNKAIKRKFMHIQIIR